ncbi:L-threonine ammonia-lyase [Tistlia consotensis]|uniref:L-threonine ammonia-lyase n=1 Tax=Tistlia consotensis USBA 355 TaxID=560819 RepID=A0A1Y6CEE7_9PROT|nr:hydroxyectoine utilization dehydratase EutB [Tistlia consotensis]SMF56936.1 L-threonine ammonia-lyase [Tistlia consotensis USBA 355]SNR45110.1 L-threonine ammonia-lyase [Tistlia consotensis]
MYTSWQPAPLELDDVRRAAGRISGVALRTPLVPSPALSAEAGTEVLLKLETLQPIGAFKIRGAANAVAQLPPAHARAGVTCASTGNHGRAVAYAARRLGIPAIVCMSRLVPANKVAAIEALGAEARIVGRSQDEAQTEVDRLVAEEGLAEIPPFDQADVVAGQGTIALELLEDAPRLDTLLVPLSGGGLLGGIALAAKALKPAIRIVGISMARGAAMHASLAAGRPVEVEEQESLADSLGGGIGLANRHTFALVRDLVDRVVLLDEPQIARGMRWLFEEEGLVVEGAGAVGVSVLLERLVPDLGASVGVVVSGRNVDRRAFLTAIGY